MLTPFMRSQLTRLLDDAVLSLLVPTWGHAARADAVSPQQVILMGWVEGYRSSGEVKGLEGLDSLHPGGAPFSPPLLMLLLSAALFHVCSCRLFSFDPALHVFSCLSSSWACMSKAQRSLRHSVAA